MPVKINIDTLQMLDAKRRELNKELFRIAHVDTEITFFVYGHRRSRGKKGQAGIEFQAFELAERLAKRGMNPWFINDAQKRELNDMLKEIRAAVLAGTLEFKKGRTRIAQFIKKCYIDNVRNGITKGGGPMPPNNPDYAEAKMRSPKKDTKIGPRPYVFTGQLWKGIRHRYNR